MRICAAHHQFYRFDCGQDSRIVYAGRNRADGARRLSAACGVCRRRRNGAYFGLRLSACQRRDARCAGGAVSGAHGCIGGSQRGRFGSCRLFLYHGADIQIAYQIQLINNVLK